jgi:hypothetical protein
MLGPYVVFADHYGNYYHQTTLTSWLLKYKNTHLMIHTNGLIELDGNIKDAARALFLKIIEVKNNNISPTYSILNYSFGPIHIDFEDNFTLSYTPYVGMDVDPLFLQIKEEFDKIKHLIIFW